MHVIEGLRDGRVAMYSKMHHALIDGVSSMRLMQSVLSTDPDERDMAPTWSAEHVGRPRRRRARRGHRQRRVRPARSAPCARRSAISADAAGLPGALVRTLSRGVRNETSALSLYAPRTIINKRITGSRRFAAAGLADRAAAGDRQGHRDHAQRRRARDVQRRDADLPRRARRAAGHVPGRDGPGRAQGQERTERLGLRRQRGRRGDGQARHRPGRPGRPAAGASTTRWSPARRRSAR